MVKKATFTVKHAPKYSKIISSKQQRSAGVTDDWGICVDTIRSKGSSKEGFPLISERIDSLSYYEEIEQTKQMI